MGGIIERGSGRLSRPGGRPYPSAQEVRDAHVHVIGVGDVPVAQHPGELHRLDLEMTALDAVGIVAAEIEARDRMLRAMSAVIPCPLGGISRISCPA
jgi:hypothetical protein